MTAVGYVRISISDQSEYSVEYQERLIRQYCEANKLALLAVFKDEGESSYTFDRPDFKALEAFIKLNKNVDYLIILDHDRFSRNLAEALLKIKELQDRWKIRVLATSDPIDTDFTDPTTFMMRAFKYMMAESELHNIRKRTKNGMIQAAMNGRHANMAPYGYKNARDAQDRPILVVEEEKARIVQFMFKEYLNGADLEQIRNLVRELGYKQSGNSAIRRILSNPVYAGLIPVPQHKGRKKQFAKGLHSPLMAEQDFWRAQERLIGKTIAVQKREEVPLRGVLHCWCGRKVTAGNSRSHTGKYYWYYLCPEHKANLAARKLHEQFNELLDSMSLTLGEIEWLREKWTRQIGEQIDARGGEVRRLTMEIKRVHLEIQTSERKYLLKPNVSEETFDKVMTELRGEEARYQKELAEQNMDQQAYWERLNTLLPRLSHLRNAYNAMDLEKKQQFINQGFDNNLWYENGIYRTHKLHPFLMGKELELKEKGLLSVEKPIQKLGQGPTSTRDGNGIELSSLEGLAALLQLIA